MRRVRNIAAGFMDEEGIFHPIRASHDYKPSRAGERPKRKTKAKAKAKRRVKNPWIKASAVRVRRANGIVHIDLLR